MTRRAFTLIELLVVITVIAILIGILVPVLASARESSIGTLCLANLSQLNIGVHQHAAENKSLIPYGPVEAGSGQLNGADDFYFINGMTTSQISDKLGQPVGAGLMLDDYLSDSPQVLFCPGSDQPIDAKEALKQVGVSSVISGYIYRHASKAQDDLLESFDTKIYLRQNPSLDKLGKNSQGEDIRALFVDNNFLANAFSGTFYRSNHDRKFANISYADGHAEQRSNADGEYSAKPVGTNLYSAIGLMRQVLENADKPE